MTTIEPADRAHVLEQRRTTKMARSAHAYVRGNTIRFYEWLQDLDASCVPSGPAIWICGDCHVGNLGPLADTDGHVDIQIRDLDQTVIGNPAHDLIRLGLSLASAARGADLPGVTTARMLEEMVNGYTVALKRPDLGDGLPEPGVVRTVRRRALGRRWKHLARERLADVRPTIPLGSNYWALTDEEREALQALFKRREIAELVSYLHVRKAGAEVELIDAAYWMKGCSSLGKLRFAALIEMDGEEKAQQRLALIDLKEGVEAAAPPAPGARMPTHHGERVVAGARALSPNLGDRMIAADLLGRPMVLRELTPHDLKLEIDQFTRAEAVQAARYLAYVVGRAHARQLDEADRGAWGREMGRQRDNDLDAPHWLWSSVVALAAEHERGYLEHCRRYALAASA